MDWFDTGKDLFNKARKWGETIGDMTAASDNPVEKNGWMDEQQKKISTELEKSGLYLRPRFSPGYGDFPIEFQEPIMRMLDCAKKIGLTMTDSYMMSPTKSVTAIIGISTEKERCPISGCEACGKKDCAYRR